MLLHIDIVCGEAKAELWWSLASVARRSNFRKDRLRKRKKINTQNEKGEFDSNMGLSYYD